MSELQRALLEMLAQLILNMTKVLIFWTFCIFTFLLSWATLLQVFATAGSFDFHEFSPKSIWGCCSIGEARQESDCATCLRPAGSCCPPADDLAKMSLHTLSGVQEKQKFRFPPMLQKSHSHTLFSAACGERDCLQPVTLEKCHSVQLSSSLRFKKISCMCKAIRIHLQNHILTSEIVFWPWNLLTLTNSVTV